MQKHNSSLLLVGFVILQVSFIALADKKEDMWGQTLGSGA